MIKQVLKTLLPVSIALMIFTSCHKDKPVSCTDPSRIFISYSWKYYEQTNITTIAADFMVDNQNGISAANCGPFTITFNNDTFHRQVSTYYLHQYGLQDSGTLVYTDVTGVRYSTEVKPIQIPQIPDTFTSVNHNGGYYFYWEGDSTGYNERIDISFCSKDSFTCYAPTAFSFSYGIWLWDVGLWLPVGANNTEASLTLERNEMCFPTGAPKGACLKQIVYGRSKIISVY